MKPNTPEIEIRKNMLETGTTPDMAAEILGVCRKTFDGRLKHPENFTVTEIMRMQRFISKKTACLLIGVDLEKETKLRMEERR